MRPWRAWMLAARVPTLSAAVAPVLVGTAAAAGTGRFHLLPFLAALVAAVCTQVATNFANDANDFLRGADTSRRLGPQRVTQSGLLTPRQVLTGAYLAIGFACAAGAYLVALRGWPVLVIGALSIASGLAYTGGPWPLGYHGLGEVFVFIFFGIVAVTGSAYVQTGGLSDVALAASVPVGLLVTAILVLNNLRDIETDRAAGKHTLPVRIGPRATRVLYVLCLAGAAAGPGIMRAAGLIGPWFWLPWLTAPLLVSLVRTALGDAGAASLNSTLRKTSLAHLLFGMLFAASLLW
ncbi:MAG: 1,4-dihydroxy-2-naphthoate polyprenyltransferase [Armatimonadota bacterium]